MLLWEKTDFKTNTVAIDKDRNAIMIHRSIQQEDITLGNIYEYNIGAPKNIKTHREILNRHKGKNWQ